MKHTAWLLAALAVALSATQATAAVLPPTLGADVYGAPAREALRPQLTSDPRPVTILDLEPQGILEASRLMPIGVESPLVNIARAGRLLPAGGAAVTRLTYQDILERQSALDQEAVLADVGGDEVGNPLQDFSYMSIGPAPFALLRRGMPAGTARMWSHTTETALSYVRAHRNLELAMTFRQPETNGPGQAFGRMIESQAQMLDNLNVELDTSQMVPASAAFGAMEESTSRKTHPGVMLAVGLDTGLLPAMLGEVGFSTTIIVGQSTNPGPFISFVTNVEIPSERVQERTTPSDRQPQIQDIIAGVATGPGIGFGAGGVADSETLATDTTGDTTTTTGGGGGGGGLIPITPTPPVPEPTTMLLLGAGLAALAARRRSRSR